MQSIYLEEAERVARQSFSMWNREPASPSYGSFDRQYWGWKYKDFSDATLQYGVRLAVEYAIARNLTGNLPPLLAGYAQFCASIQLPDGSFNQCYPYERTPGVVYDILSTLIYVRQSPFLEDHGARSLLEGTIAKAAGFALRTDEKHGEVANHLAEYAYELLSYAEYTGDDRARRKAEQYIERFLRALEPNEGWFLEYNGPDPGYQTRCLRYLVKIADLVSSDELWAKVRLAAGFVNEVLMPDGSVHPMLGCRSTALLYPSAFERLACKDNAWQGLASRVREGWELRKVPMPSEIDFGNAIRLADDALDAHRHLVSNSAAVKCANTAIPTADRDFPAAGLHIRRTADRMVFVGSRIGGVVIVYARTPESGWELVHENSGYLLKSTQEIWLTRMPGTGSAVQMTKEHLHVEGVFSRSLHDEVTPFRLIVLRLLNLTLLRSQWAGDLFRKLVVRMLMSGTKSAPLRLFREVALDAHSVRIVDRIDGDGDFKSERFELFSCRRAIGTHMASSRYFQESELAGLELQWINRLPWPSSNGSVKDTILRVPSSRMP